MNKVILIGRLTRDPEIRYTQTGIAVCTFTLAVDRRYARKGEDNGQPTADFIPIVAWRKLAEICGNNLTKGRRILIEGSMQTRNYEAQDGTKRYVTEVIADGMEFLDSRSATSGEGGYSHTAPQAGTAPSQPPADSFGPAIPEEEIPF